MSISGSSEDFLIAPSPPSLMDRNTSNSSSLTSGSPRPFDIQALSVEEVDNVWSKLRESSFGDYVLTHDDSYEILCLISSLVKADVTNSFDEVTAKILHGLGQDDAQDVDEAYMKHLATSYSKLINADDENILTSATEENESTNSPSKKDQKEILHEEDSQLIERLRLSGDAILLLGHAKEWNFDIFQLQEFTPYPLVAIAETALNEFNLTFSLNVHVMKLRRFLVEIADSYLTTSSYHNQLHGADVTQTMYHFLSQCKLSSVLGLNNLAILSLIISAAIHDVGHPGVSGKYLIAVGDILSVQYNDSSPLENMHLATAFQILSKPQNNFMEKFARPVFREFRRMVIEMVLTTDNDRHFALMERVEGLINSGDAIMSTPSPMARRDSFRQLSRTQSAFLSKSSKVDQSMLHLINSKRRSSDTANLGTVSNLFPEVSVSPPSNSASASSKLLLPSPPPPHSPRGSSNSASVANPQVTEARQLLLMQLALHAADVSNPVKPWELHLVWYPRLMKEFYHQGDLEREQGYPITYGFDRFNPLGQPKFQLGFLKAIVFPMYKTFARIPGLDISHCISCLENNISNWESIQASELGGDALKDPNQVSVVASRLGLTGKQWSPKRRIANSSTESNGGL